MKLKAGVSLRNIQPEAVVGMMIVNNCYERSGSELVITSCNDSRHRSGSLHYSGRAFDCRTKWVMARESIGPLFDSIVDSLGSEFDVVLEDFEGENEHIHVEYDPR